MFRFVHSADWHVGKAYGGLPAERQGVLRDARLSAVDTLAEVARRNAAAHVVVAGDVFDSLALPAREIARLIERLKAHADLVWHLLPGNHDPDRPGGLYERIVRAGLPGNVMVCRAAEPVPLAPGVMLLPAPLSTKAQTRDPTAWMDAAPTPAGSLRIGLAHGSVQSFGTDGDVAARIDPARVRSAGLAYLALGDWHGTKEVGPAAWYAGAPEPDRYLGNESGQALVVSLGDGNTGLSVTPVTTRRHDWLQARLTVRSLADYERWERAIAEAGALDRTLVRLALEGQVPLADHGAILSRVAALESRLFHLDLDRHALGIAPGDDDLSTLGAGSDLAQAAERLMALREQPDQRDAAERALEILFRLAAEQRP